MTQEYATGSNAQIKEAVRTIKAKRSVAPSENGEKVTTPRHLSTVHGDIDEEWFYAEFDDDEFTDLDRPH